MQVDKRVFPGDRVALAALLLVASVLVAGDFRVVLANSSADDSPVLFGRFLANPERFQNDLLPTYGYVYAYGTAVHWVPALLHRITGFPLALSAYLITLLQTILLGLALHGLARTVTNDPWKAWLTACFGLAAEAYSWNLANYSSQMHSPYAGHLVLPLVLFGLNAWLQERPRRAAVWLSAAALVHPTLTLLTLGLLIGRTVLRGFAPIGRRGVLMLVLPVVLALLPPLVIQARFGGNLSEAIVADLMLVNMHMNPFRYDRWYNTLLPTMTSFLGLVALGAWRSKAPAGYRALLLDAVLYTAMLGICHYIAVQGRVSILMTLVPLRFTTVVIGLGLPLAIAYLTDALTTGRFPQRWAAALLLILPGLASMGLSLGAIAACALGELERGSDRRPAWRSLSALIFFGWLAMVLAAFWLHGLPATTRSHLFASTVPGLQTDPTTFTLAVTLAGLIALLAMRNRHEARTPERPSARAPMHPNARALLAACAVLAALLLMRDARKGAETLNSEMRDLYAAQEWARHNTPGDAIFLLEPNIAWRVGADRPVIEALAPPLHVYSRREDAQALIAARMELLRYRPWTNEAAILEFARRFGGQYLVRYVERPRVFDPVYRNGTYAIYRLPPIPRSSLQ